MTAIRDARSRLASGKRSVAACESGATDCARPTWEWVHGISTPHVPGCPLSVRAPTRKTFPCSGSLPVNGRRTPRLTQKPTKARREVTCIILSESLGIVLPVCTIKARVLYIQACPAVREW